MKEKLTKLRHIARVELKVAPTVGIAVRIGRPVNVLNPNRLEQLPAGELQGIRGGDLGKNGGEHMRVAAAIGKARTGLRDHRQIKHELEPVRAASHFEQSRLFGLETTVPPCLHRQQVVERDFLLPFIRVQYGSVWEQA